MRQGRQIQGHGERPPPPTTYHLPPLPFPPPPHRHHTTTTPHLATLPPTHPSAPFQRPVSNRDTQHVARRMEHRCRKDHGTTVTFHDGSFMLPHEITVTSAIADRSEGAPLFYIFILFFIFSFLHFHFVHLFLFFFTFFHFFIFLSFFTFFIYFIFIS